MPVFVDAQTADEIILARMLTKGPVKAWALLQKLFQGPGQVACEFNLYAHFLSTIHLEMQQEHRAAVFFVVAVVE